MHKCIIINNFNIDNFIPSCCGTNDSKHSTKTDLLPTMEVLHVFHAGRMHPSHCLLLDLIWALLRIAEHHSAGWIFWKWTLQESFLNQKWTEANRFAYGVIQCRDKSSMNR